jgi:uncharacterized protein (DUF362 family)
MKRIIKIFFFPVIGLLSLTWFLIRVIPKPSRAAYPCMRVTAPIASSFILYLLGIFSSIVVFKKSKQFLHQSRYLLFSITLIAGLILGTITYLQNQKRASAAYLSSLEEPNQPMGTGKGIYPGRVAWIHDPNATDETCTNTSGDYWWQDSNTNQTVVNKMLADALKMLTGKESVASAWDGVFRDYNKTHGKGNVGYSAGEKIVIKINLNGGVSGTSYERWDYDAVDTSPQMVYAILDQLINTVGVAQGNIGFGDPGRNVDNIFWNKFHSIFPDVKYWGKSNGRTAIVKSSNYQVFTSDGTQKDWLPTFYLEAAYMINVPVLKKHHRAGISLSSKNHFGTFTPFHNNSASHWHFSLPASEGGGDVNNGDYHLYRCFVDFMGHKQLGGKTILYIIDGLWGSTNWAHPPIKWRMAPFNNDWPSSILVSQDPVAIESVGFDFLYKEFDETHPTEGSYDPSDNSGPFPHYAGVDDFLHQAADSLNWPAGLYYDPENDGTRLKRSMGVHEHWNNAIDKKYSKNLGTGQGIEFVSTYNPPTPVELVSFNAQLKNNLVRLNWRTATEKNNYGFEMERRHLSPNQSQFSVWEKIAFIKSHGTTDTPQEYSYCDVVNSEGYHYQYRLKMIDVDGTVEYSQEAEIIATLPNGFFLSQNYPNPFFNSGSGTTISYDLAAASVIELAIFNVNGQKIKTLVKNQQSPGRYSQQWDGKMENGNSAPSGVYFYKIIAQNNRSSFEQTRKMILNK